MRADGPHVVIVVENLPVPFDRRVWLEASTLRANGYRVTVVCPKGVGFEEDEAVLDGVRILRHALPPEQSSAAGYIREYVAALLEERRILSAVRRDGPIDIIHLCNPPDVLFFVALRFKLLDGTRVIFDQHDINPELWEAKRGRRGVIYWGLRLVEWLTFHTADVVISTNESYRKVALLRGHRRPDRVFIVRSAPDLSRFRATAPVERYRRGRRYLVGYVGVIGEQDGLDQLLMAVRHMVHVRQRDDVGFCIVGSGPALDASRALAQELSIEDFVEFTGRASDGELLERLSTCDICVDPDPKTPFNDSSTMNKILEYMALGKPIVQFDLVEGRRSAGEASLYVPAGDAAAFGDAILALADDPCTRDAMGAAGLSRMTSTLEWRHQTAPLLSAYECALRTRHAHTVEGDA